MVLHSMFEWHGIYKEMYEGSSHTMFGLCLGIRLFLEEIQGIVSVPFWSGSAEKEIGMAFNLLLCRIWKKGSLSLRCWEKQRSQDRSYNEHVQYVSITMWHAGLEGDTWVYMSASGLPHHKRVIPNHSCYIHPHSPHNTDVTTGGGGSNPGLPHERDKHLS